MQTDIKKDLLHIFVEAVVRATQRPMEEVTQDVWRNTRKLNRTTVKIVHRFTEENRVTVEVSGYTKKELFAIGVHFALLCNDYIRTFTDVRQRPETLMDMANTCVLAHC